VLIYQNSVTMTGMASLVVATLPCCRILAHSHVNEQPFTRSGGPVRIGADDVVIVRAHMNDAGYGKVVFHGSAAAGFSAVSLDSGFADDLSNVEPLTTNCAF
jgi:hypothetical protein